MNKMLSKIGLLLMAIINCPYVFILIRGLMDPHPIIDKKYTEGFQSAIVLSVLFTLLCIAGLFVKEKHVEKYRKCSEILTVIRLFVGECGALCFSFYLLWRNAGVANPLTIFADLDKPFRILVAGVILLLLTLPVMTHLAALMCFEYGLPKDRRAKNLRIYKRLFVSLLIIALIGISAMLISYFLMI